MTAEQAQYAVDQTCDMLRAMPLVANMVEQAMGCVCYGAFVPSVTVAGVNGASAIVDAVWLPLDIRMSSAIESCVVFCLCM